MISSEKGMTLIELVMVIIIIGIIAGVAMQSMTSVISTGRMEATKRELTSLAHAVAGNPEIIGNGARVDFGYFGDVGALPPDLEALVNNPGYGTWDGPYINTDFVQAADDYKKDAWGVAYSYNGGVEITSTGSGSNITRKIANNIAELTGNSIQGTVLDAEGVPPGLYSDRVWVGITYPDGSGTTADITVNPSPNGNYTIGGLPVGNHRLTTVFEDTQDTVISYVTLPPNSAVVNNVRFGSALWAIGNGASGNGLDYVTGSATLYGSSGQHVQFKVYNNTGEQVTIEWLEATFSHVPEAFFERVKWNNAKVADSNDPRFASGDRVDFSTPKVINNGTSKTIKLERFRDAQSGSAGWAFMGGTSITVLLSDNSEITVTF